MYKIAKSNLPALFRAIAETKELYLPIRRAGQVNFGPWSEDVEVDVETLKTVKSPKDVFFPQSENLYSCEREGKDIKIEPQALQDQEFVVFGMKACDIKGVEVLDKVFLADPIDTFYAARRDHGIIVAMACHEPEESCFCKVFGVDCADPEKSAADVAVWMLGDDLMWKAITEKGEALTKAVESLLEGPHEPAGTHAGGDTVVFHMEYHRRKRAEQRGCSYENSKGCISKGSKSRKDIR